MVTQHMYDVALKDLQEWPMLCSVSVRTKSGASLHVASQVPLEKDRRTEPALSTAFEPGGSVFRERPQNGNVLPGIPLQLLLRKCSVGLSWSESLD